MYKGTTPTHTFKVKIDTSAIKEVKITYKQNDKIVLTKRTSDCTIEYGKIITQLSQEDTFLFDSARFVNIQLRVLLADGQACNSPIFRKSVGDCLDDEVLV